MFYTSICMAAMSTKRSNINSSTAKIAHLSEGGKIQVSQCQGDYILYGGAKYLWILNIELASHNPSGTYNFEVAH
jgi:hypothetical protein